MDAVAEVVRRVDAVRLHRVRQHLVEGEDAVAGAGAVVPRRHERADGVPVAVVPVAVAGAGGDGRDVHLDPRVPQPLEDLAVAGEGLVGVAAVREVVGAVVVEDAGDSVQCEDVPLQPGGGVQAAERVTDAGAGGGAGGAADAFVGDGELTRGGEFGGDAPGQVVRPAQVLARALAARAAAGGTGAVHDRAAEGDEGAAQPGVVHVDGAHQVGGLRLLGVRRTARVGGVVAGAGRGEVVGAERAVVPAGGCRTGDGQRHRDVALGLGGEPGAVAPHLAVGRDDDRAPAVERDGAWGAFRRGALAGGAGHRGRVDGEGGVAEGVLDAHAQRVTALAEVGDHAHGPLAQRGAGQVLLGGGPRGEPAVVAAVLAGGGLGGGGRGGRGRGDDRRGDGQGQRGRDTSGAAGPGGVEHAGEQWTHGGAFRRERTGAVICARAMGRIRSGPL